MISVLPEILLGILTISLLMINEYYVSTPVLELKRQVASGSKRAKLLFEVARHGSMTSGILKFSATVSFAFMAVLISKNHGVLYASMILVAYMGLGFYLTSHFRWSHKLAVFIAPYLASFIVLIKPYVTLVSLPFRRFMGSSENSKIYEMEDLLSLIKRQSASTNNRIQKSELKMAENVLIFSSKVTENYMTPRKVVHFVDSKDQVGTILISELHESGFSRFPVYSGNTDNVVGTLYLKDLVEKRASGKVEDTMSSEVVFVEASQTLNEVLDLFLKSKHHLFVVRNNFSEVVGIITIEDVLEQLIGRKIVDETDVHEDMRNYAEDNKTG